jgi:hypothetical protein
VKLFVVTEELSHDEVAKLIMNYRITLSKSDEYESY